jgi:hypothetical protein
MFANINFLRSIWADLQGELPTIKYCTFEWVSFLLQIGFGTLPRGNEVLQHGGQKTFTLRSGGEEIYSGRYKSVQHPDVCSDTPLPLLGV